MLAGVEGNRCFLVMPSTFWQEPDVAPLLESLGQEGGGQAAEQGSRGVNGKQQAFSGLVHVRFR